jgi:hypothetical protein
MIKGGEFRVIIDTSRYCGCAISRSSPESGTGALAFPALLSDAVNRYYREKGIQVLPEINAVNLMALLGGMPVEAFGAGLSGVGGGLIV